MPPASTGSGKSLQVVVASAEQLAEIPAEYLPATTGDAPAVVTAAAAIPGVNLDTGTAVAVDTADEAERRQSLDEAVDEFTAHVQAETAKIDAERAQLEQDRATLARERADFEVQRSITTSGAGTDDTAGDTGAASSTTEGAGTGDISAPAATPAKRTRAAAKEGA